MVTIGKKSPVHATDYRNISVSKATAASSPKRMAMTLAEMLSSGNPGPSFLPSIEVVIKGKSGSTKEANLASSKLTSVMVGSSPHPANTIRLQITGTLNEAEENQGFNLNLLILSMKDYPLGFIFKSIFTLKP